MVSLLKPAATIIATRDSLAVSVDEGPSPLIRACNSRVSIPMDVYHCLASPILREASSRTPRSEARHRSRASRSSRPTRQRSRRSRSSTTTIVSRTSPCSHSTSFISGSLGHPLRPTRPRFPSESVAQTNAPPELRPRTLWSWPELPRRAQSGSVESASDRRTAKSHSYWSGRRAFTMDRQSPTTVALAVDNTPHADLLARDTCQAEAAKRSKTTCSDRSEDRLAQGMYVH